MRYPAARSIWKIEFRWLEKTGADGGVLPPIFSIPESWQQSCFYMNSI
jgi:hypothetical protein